MRNKNVERVKAPVLAFVARGIVDAKAVAFAVGSGEKSATWISFVAWLRSDEIANQVEALLDLPDDLIVNDEIRVRVHRLPCPLANRGAAPGLNLRALILAPSDTPCRIRIKDSEGDASIEAFPGDLVIVQADGRTYWSADGVGRLAEAALGSETRSEREPVSTKAFVMDDGGFI